MASYWDYLKLDQLLHLQGGVENDGDVALADELHFIVVHQTYELWFKLTLREMRLARDRLAVPRVSEETIPMVVHHLRRINAILRLAVQQMEVMETLAPQDFLAFRDKLIPASGFQSFQMRELEMVMGLDEADRIGLGQVRPLEHILGQLGDSPAGRMARERITAARAEPTMLSVLNEWLYRTPIQASTPGDPGDEAVVDGFVASYLARMDASLEATRERLVAALGAGAVQNRFAEVREAARAFLHADGVPEGERQRIRRVRAAALFIESYRDLPLLSWPRLLLDLVVELEEHLVLWRHRHARMVERVIGRRVGTGGSAGVEYLDKTVNYRVFRDLWAIRTVLLAKEDLPELVRPSFYGFVGE